MQKRNFIAIDVSCKSEGEYTEEDIKKCLTGRSICVSNIVIMIVFYSPTDIRGSL